MIDGIFRDNEDCPDCGGFIWRDGPRGGLSQNIECVKCGSRFNVTRWNAEWDQRMHGRVLPGRMPIIWAERIPSEKDGGSVWRTDLFPKVLE